MPQFINNWTDEEEREWKRRLLAGLEGGTGQHDPLWSLPNSAAPVETMGPVEVARWAEIVVQPKPLAEHGTQYRYGRGCRCAPCRLSNRNYGRALKGMSPVEQQEAATSPTR